MTDKPVTNVIFTGRLTTKRLKELADVYLPMSSGEDHLWNPEKNHQVISLVLQPDGHYIGCVWKNDQVITVRDLVPEHVLTKLLTHG